MTGLKVEVGTISEKDKNNWNNAVEQSQEGGFFHRYEWLKLIEKGLGLEPYHIIVKKGGAIIGGFPNFVEKLRKAPFKRLASIGIGGFFIVSEKEEFLQLLIAKAEEKRGVMSHRIQTDGYKYIKYSQWLTNSYGYKLSLDTCKFIIDIDRPFKSIETNMSKYKRRDIRKIDESPLKIEEPEITKENLELFYSLYKETMERVQGIPMPISFFTLLSNEDNKEIVKLFLAKYKDNVVAAFLHLLDNSNSVIYEFFAGTKEEFFEHKPNDLLRKHSILWAQDNGFHTYDMGGTVANFTNGIFEFKRRWGGQVFPYLTWEKPLSKWRWCSYRVGLKIYKRWISREP